MQVENKIAILELIAKYNHFIDYKDIDRLDEIWSKDGKFIADIPPINIEGFDGLQKLFADTVKNMPNLRHITNNIYIEGNDQQAVYHAYVQILDANNNTIIAIGRYKDTVINTPDGWRILERNLTAG